MTDKFFKIVCHGCPWSKEITHEYAWVTPSLRQRAEIVEELHRQSCVNADTEITLKR